MIQIVQTSRMKALMGRIDELQERLIDMTDDRDSHFENNRRLHQEISMMRSALICIIAIVVVYSLTMYIKQIIKS